MNSQELLNEMENISEKTTSYSNAEKLSELYGAWKALQKKPWLVPAVVKDAEQEIKETVLAGAQYIQSVENYTSEKDCLIKKCGRLQKECESLKDTCTRLTDEKENLENQFNSLMEDYYRVFDDLSEKNALIDKMQLDYDSLYTSHAGTPDTVTIKCDDLKQISSLSKGQIISLIDEYFTDSKKFHYKEYNRFVQFVKGKFRNS